MLTCIKHREVPFGATYKEVHPVVVIAVMANDVGQAASCTGK